MTGIGPQHTASTRLWFGKASNAPGFRSLPHHHGKAETGAYLLSGRARIYFGKNFEEYLDLSEGDFMFVPPFVPHLEANMSTTKELWWLYTDRQAKEAASATVCWPFTGRFVLTRN